MNQYGAQIRRHWQRHRPRELAELRDPEAFFTEQGQLADQQIQDQARKLEAQAEEPTGFLERLGRMNNARFEAEATVMRELLADPDSED